MDKTNAAPWALLLMPWAWALAMFDVMQGAAVRGCCEAMRAARGERL